MIPALVRFDRFAQVTGGLVVLAPGSSLVAINGMALVTGFLANEGWVGCYSAVSTGWTACFSPVVTGWTQCYAPVSTTWTLVPGG